MHNFEANFVLLFDEFHGQPGVRNSILGSYIAGGPSAPAVIVHEHVIAEFCVEMNRRIAVVVAFRHTRIGRSQQDDMRRMVIANRGEEENGSDGLMILGVDGKHFGCNLSFLWKKMIFGIPFFVESWEK